VSGVILADLEQILSRLDEAGEVLCAAQLQMVIDTLERRFDANARGHTSLVSSKAN
jgi:hypothetical protein